MNEKDPSEPVVWTCRQWLRQPENIRWVYLAGLWHGVWFWAREQTLHLPTERQRKVWNEALESIALVTVSRKLMDLCTKHPNKRLYRAAVEVLLFEAGFPRRLYRLNLPGRRRK